MATSTEDTQRDYELGDHNDIPVKASVIIYKGSAVGASGGLARSLVKADPFLGFARRKADNDNGANAEISVAILSKGRIILPITGLVLADLGKDVYASDDMTFVLTASGNSKIGKVIRVIEAGEGVVAFNAGA